MGISQQQNPSSEESVVITSRKRIFLTVFLILSVLGGVIAYFIYQRSFMKQLEDVMTEDGQPPELIIHKAYLRYTEFFEKQPNITGSSFRDLCRRHYQINLPPAKAMKASIIRKLRDELIPEKYPISTNEYRVLKQEEAQKKFRLAKIGETVTVRSPRFGKYTGVFNGFGSKKSSIRIDRRFFSFYDLERETKALFDPMLNSLVQTEYVLRECDRYQHEIKQYAIEFLKKEMKDQGYLYRGKFYSPAEYIAALEENKFSQDSQQKKDAYKSVKTPELKKNSESKRTHLTQQSGKKKAVPLRSVDSEDGGTKKSKTGIQSGKDKKHPFLERLRKL